MPPKSKPLAFRDPELDRPPGTGDRPDTEDFHAIDNPDFDVASGPVEDDSFASFFDNAENYRVDVIRISPEEYKGELSKGYQGMLSPGDTLETLRVRFGGGKYRLNKRSNVTGKILTRATVDVAGAPVVPNTATDPPSLSPPSDPRVPIYVPANPNPPPPVTIDVAGQKVQLPAALADQFAYMQAVVLWSKAIKEIFPTPADPNQKMLELLLHERNVAPAPDMLEVFLKFKNAFPEIFDRSDVGSANWLSVLQEAIKQAGGVVAALGDRRPAGRPAPPVIAGAPPSARALPAPADKVDVDNQPAAEPAAESEVSLTPQPTAFQIGMAALGEVVKQFRLEPPKEPSRVVALLDQLFQLGPDKRQLLVAFKETGFDWCEGQLEDVFAEDPNQRDEFRRYYETIFTEFTRSDREAKYLA